MKIIIRCILLFIAINTAAVGAQSFPIVEQGCQSQFTPDSIGVFPEACLEGKVYRIYYRQKTTSIVVAEGKRNVILQRMPKGFDPALVGADVFIGFLPDRLQAYKKMGILTYVSSIRSNGGGGGGQCGSGAEIFLNFLNVRSPVPKIASSILIGSCEESIELMDQDISDGKLGTLAVIDSKLSLQFMHYRGIGGYPTATVSTDLKRLDFGGGR